MLGEAEWQKLKAERQELKAERQERKAERWQNIVLLVNNAQTPAPTELKKRPRKDKGPGPVWE
eukprot:3718224-Prymnesium_polylepis.1